MSWFISNPVSATKSETPHRSLKRRLSDIVWRQLIDDARRAAD
jgi:hypothetical protein